MLLHVAHNQFTCIEECSDETLQYYNYSHVCMSSAWYCAWFIAHSLVCLYTLLCTAEITVDLSATTVRFTWPLVTSTQVLVSGYTIAIEAVDPAGLMLSMSVNTAPQQNTSLLSGLQEGVRYSFQLHVLSSSQQDRLVVFIHQGMFTTDTAGTYGILVPLTSSHVLYLSKWCLL